jgi:phenylalanine-4-hydroxylase
VPGLIPEEAFFALLAQRRFPVTEWLRKPEEFDYVVEPDVFHDLRPRAAALQPGVRRLHAGLWRGGLKASRLDACELLARLYWYTVEFGLIDTPQGCAPTAPASCPRPASCATACAVPNRGAWPSTCSG